MAISLLLHVSNDEPLIVEVDEMPSSSATCVVGLHPRRRDNKDITYILPDVTTVIFPMWRINFIEVLPTGDEDEVISLIRE